MDAYLEIAKRILAHHKAPLSAKKIIEIAYKGRMVPIHLHGKTQHKTLQARIAEDIRKRPLHSEFVRTEPGRFFLRELLSDDSTPENFRKQFLTRPRKYELQRFFCLFIMREAAHAAASEVLISKCLTYQSYNSVDRGNKVPLTSFSIFERNGLILVHRKTSRYKDPIKADRSIGFVEYLLPDDVDIFNSDALGMRRGVERILVSDLNAHELARSPHGIAFRTKIVGSKLLEPVGVAAKGPTYMFFLLVSLDSKFDPAQRSSPLKEMHWVDILNLRSNIDDLDEVSKIAVGVIGNEIIRSRAFADHPTLDAPTSVQF